MLHVVVTDLNTLCLSCVDEVLSIRNAGRIGQLQHPLRCADNRLAVRRARLFKFRKQLVLLAGVGSGRSIEQPLEFHRDWTVGRYAVRV
ncbi:hypothetical protein C9F11_45880 (plasmid) [Streptomyces sp. YIM 121038]|nr:hypothetical protein C9F11_45880 [Streptomyces sp. YIM 121038]